MSFNTIKYYLLLAILTLISCDVMNDQDLIEAFKIRQISKGIKEERQMDPKANVLIKFKAYDSNGKFLFEKNDLFHLNNYSLPKCLDFVIYKMDKWERVVFECPGNLSITGEQPNFPKEFSKQLIKYDLQLIAYGLNQKVN